MHETGLSKEAEKMLDKWDDPQYIAGYNAGNDYVATVREDLQEEIDTLEVRNKTLEERISELNEDLGQCVSEIHDLKQPWYVKLWKKVPRISINIERGA